MPHPPIEWVDAVPSTNTALAERASGAPHGATLAARRQSSGRGRLGRSWLGLNGNLAMSVLLTDVATEELPLVTLGAGLAIVRAIRREVETAPATRAGDRFRLKWPNDVLDHEDRKLAGVLCEASWEQGRLAHVIVGIGVNVAAAPEGLPATSLAAHDIDVACEALAVGIQAALLDLDRRSVLRAWSERSCTLGRRVDVEGVRGEAVGLASDGALLVKTPEGVRRVVTGDVGFL